ncbi:hypothetical protein Ahae5227_17375 [Acinetobacter haemolyticus]|uniref:hypothetical protein n=1 Tax=Acinetobacter haemolyticus TaxID=29430 RepID=UPI001331CC5B|nr:hypothetical protein [Acinetobacter haemolyticus]QHI24466.1 hypothetical protein Ahae5227_17375 [Acinetobacter haemolyticus]
MLFHKFDLTYIFFILFGIILSSYFLSVFGAIFFLVFSVTLFFIIKCFFYRYRLYLYFFSVIYFYLINLFYYYNFKVNELGFFQNFDDSFFFAQGYKIVNGGYEFDSIYDFFLGLMVFLGGSDNYSLISLNWFLSVVLLGLISVFSSKINTEFKPFYIIALGLNAFYMEATVMLLRDLLGLIFLVISFIYIVDGKRSFHIFGVLSFLVRNMTGIITYLFYFLYNSKFINGQYKGKVVIIFSFIILFYLFYNYFPVGYLSRGGFGTDRSGFSLAAMNQARYEFFFSDNINDFTSGLIRLGFIAAPLLLLINIFSPLKISNFYSDINYLFMIDGTRYEIYVENTLNYFGILSLLHIIGLGFIFITFVNGIYNLYIRKGVNFLIIIFIISLLVATYVSFQPRHKLHFLIFLPLICSYTSLPLRKIVIYGCVVDVIILIIFLLGYLSELVK